MSRSASTSTSRTRRSTRSSQAAGHRSSRAARASTSAPPCPGSSCRRRRPRARASGGVRSTTRSEPEEAHAALERLDPGAAARVHPNDRRRVIRALELTDLGASLAPAEDALWKADARHPTLLVGPRGAARGARCPDRGEGLGDDRAGRGRRGAGGLDAAALRHRPQGARARGVRDAAGSPRPARRLSSRPSASPATSANGCGGFPWRLRSTEAVHPRR